MNTRNFIRPSREPRGRRTGGPVRTYNQTAPLLTAEQEIELAARRKAGDPEAMQSLILANLRLVFSIAAEYRGKHRTIDHDDLVQEGNIGLMRAARDFDPETHGARFATYASLWIRHHIQRLLAEQSSLIRFPYYLVILRRRYEKTRERMIEQRRLNAPVDQPIEPFLEEVAAEMGVAPSRLRHLRNTYVELRSYSSTTADDDASQDDSLAQEMPPEAPLEIAETMESLHHAMRRLTLLEAWVLRRRYRLDDSAEEVRSSAEARAHRTVSKADRSGPKSDGRRTYRELSREIARPMHELRQVERQAIAKLHARLEPVIAGNPDDANEFADIPRTRSVPIPFRARRSA